MAKKRYHVTDTDEPAVPAAGSLEDLGIDAGLVESVRFDPLCLEEEFVRTAPDVAFWNTRYAVAEEEAGMAELEKKRVEARLQLMYRQRCQDEKVKIVEKLIDSKVEMDDEMFEAKLKALRAETWRVKVKGWCQALSVRRDMLIQQGAAVREEMKGDPSLRANIAGAAALTRARRFEND